MSSRKEYPIPQAIVDNDSTDRIEPSKEELVPLVVTVITDAIRGLDGESFSIRDLARKIIAICATERIGTNGLLPEHLEKSAEQLALDPECGVIYTMTGSEVKQVAEKIVKKYKNGDYTPTNVFKRKDK